MTYFVLRFASGVSARTSRIGFSLTELLVVIAILSLLVATAVPAFNSIGASHGVSRGMYDISSLLEFARTEAIARQTHVWVGFQNATTISGSPELRMIAVCSKDGSTSTSASNLMFLTKVVRVQSAVLTDWGSLKSATKNLMPTASTVSVSNNADSITFTYGPVAGGNQFSKTVTFTPRGEAMLFGTPDANTPYDTAIDVSFRQARTTKIAADADDGALIIDGGTGTVRRVRLQ